MSPHVFQLHQVGPDLGGVPGRDGEGGFFFVGNSLKVVDSKIQKFS